MLRSHVFKEYFYREDSKMKRTSVIHWVISIALAMAVGNGVALAITAASKGMEAYIIYGILTTFFATAASILNIVCGHDELKITLSV